MPEKLPAASGNADQVELVLVPLSKSLRPELADICRELRMAVGDYCRKVIEAALAEQRLRRQWAQQERSQEADLDLALVYRNEIMRPSYHFRRKHG